MTSLKSPLPSTDVDAELAPAPQIPPVRSFGRSILRRALVGLVLIFVLALGSATLLYVSIDPVEEERSSGALDGGRAALGKVKSWGYQLQRLDIAEAMRSPHDLLVIDETLDGTSHARQLERNLARLKRKQDGSRRLILSYLSIGEAEDYRPYWNAAWVTPVQPGSVFDKLAYLPTLGPTPARANIRFAAPPGLRPLNQPQSAAPAWLGAENPEWRGNYRVRFWHPDWQRHLFGDRNAALDRIIAAGFDGVYLDRADIYAHWEHEQPTARADMTRLLEQIAAYAHRKRPDFLVVMQNAEELLAAPRLRSALDAVAKEDLLYGIDGTPRENPLNEVSSSLRYLEMARRDGLPILVVEYLDEQNQVEDARRRIEGKGFIPFFGPRALNALGQAG